MLGVIATDADDLRRPAWRQQTDALKRPTMTVSFYSIVDPRVRL